MFNTIEEYDIDPNADALQEIKALVDKASAYQQKALKEKDDQIKEMRKIIAEQNDAIVLVKKFVLSAGLPAFWDPKVTTTLAKPVKDMTSDEIIERNRNLANKYAKATSKETAPFLTFEEELEKYRPKLAKSSMTDLGEVIPEVSTAVKPGNVGPAIEETESSAVFDEEDDVSVFGMSDDD